MPTQQAATKSAADRLNAAGVDLTHATRKARDYITDMLAHLLDYAETPDGDHLDDAIECHAAAERLLNGCSVGLEILKARQREDDAFVGDPDEGPGS